MSPEVTLTWATQDAEPLIVEMARVSAPKNAKNMSTAPRLIKYLIKHKHWSPFEMANMCVEIHTTRAISPQILRHRSFSYQEFSQRYANTNEIGRIEIPHLRVQDTKNRQNSTDTLTDLLGKPATANLYRRVAIHLKMQNICTKNFLVPVWQKNQQDSYCLQLRQQNCL